MWRASWGGWSNSRAAAHLPRVDAIGGSSAGIIVDNEIRVASLLRSIPKKDFPRAARVFKRIQKEWNVPLVVMNDGDVTALAGALSLRQKGMLGVAMGSSQAGGFMDKKRRILGWLNELAFAPVDYNPDAPADEWSGDRGVGALYFSQQAVNKLLPAAGIAVARDLGLPERLKEVQALMARGDERAAKIYETIGVYLGYTIPHDADFYEFMAFRGILTCFGREDQWFGGVTCTNGAGSPRTGPYAGYTDAHMMAVRRQEQNAAALVGRYGAMLQLDYPSSAVRNPSDPSLKNDLKAVLLADREVPYILQRINHNLDRCRTQFKLVESIEQQEDRMNQLVESLCNE